jgi:ABC-type branched-subunit amino acid transport system substrate-binding protein
VGTRGLAVAVVLILAIGLQGFHPAGGLPPIKVGLVQSLSGPLAAHAREVVQGFTLGLEYATKGRGVVLGRKVQTIVEDDHLEPDAARRLVTRLCADDKVDLVVGTTGDAATLAVLPVAAEFRKVIVVEPAQADAITGERWNRYVFRTAPSARQSAIADGLAAARAGARGTSYHHELPRNAVNDWLVREHLRRFGAPPDRFAAGGFAAAAAVVAGIDRAGGTDADKLIAAMEGMQFQTPKGPMTFRAEDHQALQTMYVVGSSPAPALPRELSPQETAPPIARGR